MRTVGKLEFLKEYDPHIFDKIGVFAQAFCDVNKISKVAAGNIVDRVVSNPILKTMAKMGQSVVFANSAKTAADMINASMILKERPSYNFYSLFHSQIGQLGDKLYYGIMSLPIVFYLLEKIVPGKTGFLQKKYYSFLNMINVTVASINLANKHFNEVGEHGLHLLEPGHENDLYPPLSILMAVTALLPNSQPTILGGVS